MTPTDDFQSRYAAALLTHLKVRDEASLAVGNELGRQALLEQISMLEIIENHVRLADEFAAKGSHDATAALHFLLKTLVLLDVATRVRAMPGPDGCVSQVASNCGNWTAWPL